MSVSCPNVGVAVVAIPCMVSTLPFVTVKSLLLKLASPLVAEVASLSVIVVPEEVTLPELLPVIVIAPVRVFILATPPLPGQAWKVGAPAVLIRHSPTAPAATPVILRSF